MLRLVKFAKNLLFAIPATLLLQPFARFFRFIYYFNHLLNWIRKNKSRFEHHDFFSMRRDYSKREQLYRFISDRFNLATSEVLYLEFGVASGISFRWWMHNNQHPSSTFIGFDTFEGLPEDWGGIYDKGAMRSDAPSIPDGRGRFVKGLFQDTLVPFIREYRHQLEQPIRKVIHLDADLYSATIFTLAQLYPYLRTDDIILFDEFNVPLHEYKAFLEFSETYYTELIPVAGVNNFYQAAFRVGELRSPLP